MLNHGKSNEKIIPPSISLYHVMKRENSFHVEMPSKTSTGGNEISVIRDQPDNKNHAVVIENQIQVQAKKWISRRRRVLLQGHQ